MTFIVTSCDFFYPDRGYAFIVVNNSNSDVFAILDYDTTTNSKPVGKGLYWERVFARKTHDMLSHDPWYKVIRDSAFVYVVDAGQLDLYLPLSEEKIRDNVSCDMVLSRITLHNSVLRRGLISVVYPENVIMDGWIKPSDIEASAPQR